MSERFGEEIKICGTTTEADLEIALEAGASAVGIICHPERQTRHTVGPEQAARLVAVARGRVKTVLIPRLSESEALVRMIEAVRPHRVQLGETESLDVLDAIVEAAVVSEVAQVVHVGDRSAVARARRLAERADVIHLDTAGDRPGGTGRTHDWRISREVAEVVHELGKPVILAGGLDRDNIGEAIAAVRPDGVDVETGIKRPNGSHDPGRVKAFVAEARRGFGRFPRLQVEKTSQQE